MELLRVVGISPAERLLVGPKGFMLGGGVLGFIDAVVVAPRLTGEVPKVESPSERGELVPPVPVVWALPLWPFQKVVSFLRMGMMFPFTPGSGCCDRRVELITCPVWVVRGWVDALMTNAEMDE